MKIVEIEEDQKFGRLTVLNIDHIKIKKVKKKNRKNEYKEVICN